jgi:SSS family solute:Na+ symporter
MFLGLKFASVDQAILQRAFGARSPRVGAQGMVLSAIVTTPFAFFWVLPGLAAAKLHPEPFPTPDHAFPWLLVQTLPGAARGLLGFVLCGLVAAQVSTITADVNSVATLFTSDVYRTLKKREPTQRQLLMVVRWSSLVCGVLMLAAAIGLRFVRLDAVNANLTVVGILDMPLFVITVVYGLLWRRTNWQGAVAGFVCGGAVGILTYMLAPAEHVGLVRRLVPLISTATALVVTPVVSLLTPPPSRGLVHKPVRAAADGGGGETSHHEEHDDFHLVPVTFIGRLGLGMVGIGVIIFFGGVLSAPLGFDRSGTVAVGGMLLVLAGGLIRAYSR